MLRFREVAGSGGCRPQGASALALTRWGVHEGSPRGVQVALEETSKAKHGVAAAQLAADEAMAERDEVGAGQGQSRDRARAG